MAQRRIFIGDLQGCREEFEDLLEAVQYDPATDALHPVGDLVNRGPDSVGAVRLAQSLGAEPILGNHEIHVLRQAKDPDLRGNRRTLRELQEAPDGEELLAWLEGLPLMRCWEDVVCIHAGIHPLWQDPCTAVRGANIYDATDNDVEFAVRARYCDPNGHPPPQGDWPPPPMPFRAWDMFWRKRTGEMRTVVFGHWARRGLVIEPRTRGLDTGCVYGGRLTAWIPEEDRIVSVPARRVWYETS